MNDRENLARLRREVAVLEARIRTRKEPAPTRKKDPLDTMYCSCDGCSKDRRASERDAWRTK